MLVQALVAELAVEALDVSVLCRLAWFDQLVIDAVLLRPSDECAAGELQSVVGANRLRVAAKTRRPVEDAHHVVTADAVVEGDVHALASEVVDHGQALQAAAVGQCDLPPKNLDHPKLEELGETEAQKEAVSP